MIGLLCNIMRMFCVSDSANVLFKFLNPLSEISPYSLTTSFSVKVMGMKKIIIAKVISCL